MSNLDRVARRAILSIVNNEGVPALLGNGDGVIRYVDLNGTQHQDRMWVRLGSEGLTNEAVVTGGNVPLIVNLPVRVATRNGMPAIIGMDGARASARTGGYPINTTFHAWSHTRLGPDPIYLEGLAFLPLLVHSSDPLALTVTVEAGAFRYDRVYKIFETADSASLSTYVPATPSTFPPPTTYTQHFVIICLDWVNNALAIVDGTDTTSADSDVPFVAGDITAITIPDTYAPLAAVRFYEGQTTIMPNDIFMDLRQWGGSDKFNENVIMTDGEDAIMLDGEGNVMVES